MAVPASIAFMVTVPILITMTMTTTIASTTTMTNTITFHCVLLTAASSIATTTITGNMFSITSPITMMTGDVILNDSSRHRLVRRHVYLSI